MPKNHPFETAAEARLLRGGPAIWALGLLLVLVLELLYTAGCVNEQLLASEKRMRCGAHFNFDHRILLAVFPLNRLFRSRRAAALELGVA